MKKKKIRFSCIIVILVNMFEKKKLMFIFNFYNFEYLSIDIYVLMLLVLFGFFNRKIFFRLFLGRFNFFGLKMKLYIIYY